MRCIRHRIGKGGVLFGVIEELLIFPTVRTFDPLALIQELISASYPRPLRLRTKMVLCLDTAKVGGKTHQIDILKTIIAGFGVEFPHDKNEGEGQAREEEVGAPAETVDEDRGHHDHEEIPHPVRSNRN
jgi:hypothetical protein